MLGLRVTEDQAKSTAGEKQQYVKAQTVSISHYRTTSS